MTVFHLEVDVSRGPAGTPDRHGRNAHPAVISVGGVAIYHCLVSDPGGPYAAGEMEYDAIRQFADRLKEALPM